MKKILLIGFALSFFTATASAATVWESSGPTGEDIPENSALSNFKVSTNVRLACASENTAYAVVSDHMNGTRTYGSTAGDSLIYFQEKTAGNHTDYELTTSDSGQFDAWTSL